MQTHSTKFCPVSNITRSCRGSPMIRRVALAALLGSLALAPLACNNRTGVAAIESNGDNAPKIEIGPPLYAPVKAPPEQPAALKGPAVEPIVMPAHLRMIDKVDIPSQRDGKILFIGTEIKEGEPLSDPSRVFPHPYKRDPKTGAPTMKRYRELKPGNHIDADQVGKVPDDREAMAE